MSRIILIDAGPLGDAVGPIGDPTADAIRSWLAAQRGGGAIIRMPDLTDYEVRRSLLRIQSAQSAASVTRLDGLRALYAPLRISTDAMMAAAAFWAALRQPPKPTPTAPDKLLDADAILAGMTVTVGQPGDRVILATDNLRHMTRFRGVDARHWQTII